MIEAVERLLRAIWMLEVKSQLSKLHLVRGDVITLRTNDYHFRDWVKNGLNRISRDDALDLGLEGVLFIVLPLDAEVTVEHKGD